MIKNIAAVVFFTLFMLASIFFVGFKGDVGIIPFVEQKTYKSDMTVVTNLREQLSSLQTVNIDATFFKKKEFDELDSYYKPLPILRGQKDNPFTITQ